MDLGLWTRFADGMKQRAVGMSLERWFGGCCWEQQLSSNSVSRNLFVVFRIFGLQNAKSSPKNLMVAFASIPFHGVMPLFKQSFKPFFFAVSPAIGSSLALSAKFGSQMCGQR